MTAAHKLDHLLETHLCIEGSAAMGTGWKATTVGIFHDIMSQLGHIGAGGRQLWHKSNRQNCIYEPQKGRTIDFKIESIYKHGKGHTLLFYLST